MYDGVFLKSKAVESMKLYCVCSS